MPLLEPVVHRLELDGHEVLLTARDHAQTVELARAPWPDILVVGGQSPDGRLRKGFAVARRAEELRRLARRARPDVAFSHGSYAQVLAARAAGVRAVTMMDYEFQPANHVSFRLADRVLVPTVFPADALRRFGARPEKVVRYEGFKEELYLAGFRPDPGVLHELELDPERPIVLFRPPPEGALYHRMANERFEELLRLALDHEDTQVILLPRTPEQGRHYALLYPRLRIPVHAIDSLSLLAFVDATIGGGGTMTRESSILGTPTYTVFAGRLAAVDAELIRQGRLNDLRSADSLLRFAKKPAGQAAPIRNASAIMTVIITVLAESAAMTSVA